MSKILVMLAATICLNGCTTSEVKPFEEFQYNVELKRVETNDNQELYAVACYRRKYRVWLDKVTALENFQLVPSQECALMIGYKPVIYAKLWALMDYVRKNISTNEQREKGITREAY